MKHMSAAARAFVILAACVILVAVGLVVNLVLLTQISTYLDSRQEEHFEIGRQVAALENRVACLNGEVHRC